MKTEITLTIDPTDPSQVAAALSLFQKLSGPAVEIIDVPVKTPTAKPIKKEVVKEVAAEVKTEPTIIEEPKEEKEVAPPTPPVVKTGVKIEDVRALLSKKVAAHRDVIKKKLTEFGAANVTTLDSSNHVDFMDFLNSLS